MNKEITKILKRWATSLERYGKLDKWEFNKSLSILGDYLRSKDDSATVRGLIRQIRDKAICPSFDVCAMLSLINKVLAAQGVIVEQQFCSEEGGIERHRTPKNGQDVRYRSETEHIFGEKLRFKNGMLLRNFDIEMESARDSRKVRRIVEKRMCQAYYRMTRKSNQANKSNRKRYWEKRATAFQLYNIGQVEDVQNVSRGQSTHWKRMYDPLTGGIVFKKKMAYSSEQEALDAIEQWKLDHPLDSREMHAYKCAICHKWHIGHDSNVPYEEIFENHNVA